MARFSAERDPVCAAALTEAQVVSIDATDFAAMLRESSETCFALLGDLSRCLHTMIAKIDSRRCCLLKGGETQAIYFNLTAEGVIYLITLYKKSERDNMRASDTKRSTP